MHKGFVEKKWAIFKRFWVLSN